jgi:phosphoadenosine phosphosulfate reductase
MAKMPSESMAALSRGNAVKVRWTREKTSQQGAGSGQRGGEGQQGAGGRETAGVVVPQSLMPDAQPPTAACSLLPAAPRSWADVVAANRAPLDRAVAKAVSFIKEGVLRVGKPVAVSYSGGKDSLATLLLVLDAGIRPKVLFVDTGLEFPETVENANRTASELGLELLTEKAGEAFWENLPRFGPPGRDARWCCKCCKLGPITRLISREFSGGVLSFIGQRRYESEARASKGPVWKNPWVPGQTGASPIQDWTSLSVWLYIFSKKAAYNPWYERGLDRIGCFLCPATNLADLELVRKSFAGYERW